MDLEIKNLIEAGNEAVLAKHADFESRLNAFEAAINRPTFAKAEAAVDEVKKSFVDYLTDSGNVAKKSAYETKSISVGGLPNAVPYNVSSDIITASLKQSPITSLCSVITGTPEFGQFIKNGATYSLVGETATRPANEAEYAVKKPIFTTASSVFTLTTQAISDFGVDILGHMQSEFSADFGAAMGQYLINGTGTGVQPQGIINGGVEVEGALNIDNILSLMFKVNSVDRNNGAFIMSSEAYEAISKAKTSSGDNVVSIKDGITTLHNKPVYADDFLPATTPVLFGNYKKAFLTVVHKEGVKVLVNPYKTNGFVELSGELRFGSVILHNNAYAKLVIA